MKGGDLPVPFRPIVRAHPNDADVALGEGLDGFDLHGCCYSIKCATGSFLDYSEAERSLRVFATASKMLT